MRSARLRRRIHDALGQAEGWVEFEDLRLDVGASRPDLADALAFMTMKGEVRCKRGWGARGQSRYRLPGGED